MVQRFLPRQGADERIGQFGGARPIQRLVDADEERAVLRRREHDARRGEPPLNDAGSVRLRRSRNKFVPDGTRSIVNAP